MNVSRISLFHYDVVRELCETCRNERFHFVPIGAAAPVPGLCSHCGNEGKLRNEPAAVNFRRQCQANVYGDQQTYRRQHNNGCSDERLARFFPVWWQRQWAIHS